MKITPHQLSQHLTKQLAPIYIVSGDEPLLIDETLELIRSAANHAGFSERIRIHAEADWATYFLENLQGVSLFSTKQLIELDLTTAKLNATNSKIIQAYAQQPSSDIILVIRSQKLDSKSEQSQWYKTLDKTCMMVPIWPVSIEQLPAWLLKRAKTLKLNLTTTAAELLAQQCEGNLLAAAQELEKLSLLTIETGEAIDANTITNIATDNSHFDVFALIDSVLAGSAQRAFHILDHLIAEDTEPTLILWALARELRTMSELSQYVQQGTPLGSIFSKYRIWEKRQPYVRAFLKRHSLEKCSELLLEAAKIDRIIKGAETGNIWNELGQLTLKML